MALVGDLSLIHISKTYPVEPTGPDTAVIVIEGVDNFIKLLTDCEGTVDVYKRQSRNL